MEEKIEDLLTRGVVNIIPDKAGLEELLATGKKLNVYFGIDPTAVHIHLGNAVPIRKLQKFVELGHTVTFLIGDFTALIGDTSDKDSERPMLTYEQIQENFQTYKEQAQKVLDFSKVRVAYNSEWLKNLKFEDIVRLCQHFSVGDFVGRELIKKRLEAGKRVGLHETLYPVMQGYDSFYLDTDLQIGGADQTFNMQAGRTLIKDLSNKESFVLVTGYLEGTDGRKMSKSWGNAVWLDDAPNEMFGKIMSIRDDLIIQYFTLSTNLPMTQIEAHKAELANGKNPMEVKLVLAYTIVKELHGEQEANKAQEHFEKTFQQKEPDYSEIVSVKAGETVVDFLERVLGSRRKAKRMLAQNAIDRNGKALSANAELLDGDKIKIGKKRFITVKINEGA